MATSIKFSKVNSLPSTLAPNTMYMVAVGSSVKLYVSNDSGTKALPVLGATPEIEPFLLLGANSGPGL